MSLRDTSRPSTHRNRLLGLARPIFGLCLLSLPVACGGGEKPPTPAAVAGAASSMSGAGGSSSAGAPVQSGSAGAIMQAGGASAGSASASAGSASGGTAGGLAAGGQPATGGSPNGSCAFQCLDQCVEAGGTQKDGSCSGAQICCEVATAPANPLAHLAPAAKEVGLLLANRFSKQAVSFSTVASLPGDGYKVACEWYGALGVAKHTNSQDLVTALVTKFNPLKTNFVSAMTGGEAHVDRYIFGMVPLEIYLQTSQEEYLPLGIEVATKQHTTNQTRAAIDDMFMMTGLQLEAYRATKKKDGAAAAAKFTNFMAPIMVTYLKAQKDNGLFFHNDTQGPVHWGRGNGWFAAGMAEMLRDLPTSAPEYPAILAGYKKMMAGLLTFQSKNGLWYQVLNLPNDTKNWEETSGSAMFTYAMIAGVRRGLLDAATYVPVIEAAWAGIRKKISAQGDVSDICIGTWYKANAAEYMALTRLTGDGHGQAPVLWAAAELLR